MPVRGGNRVYAQLCSVHLSWPGRVVRHPLLFSNTTWSWQIQEAEADVICSLERSKQKLFHWTAGALAVRA